MHDRHTHAVPISPNTYNRHTIYNLPTRAGPTLELQGTHARRTAIVAPIGFLATQSHRRWQYDGAALIPPYRLALPLSWQNTDPFTYVSQRYHLAHINCLCDYHYHCQLLPTHSLSRHTAPILPIDSFLSHTVVIATCRPTVTNPCPSIRDVTQSKKLHRPPIEYSSVSKWGNTYPFSRQGFKFRG